MKGDTKLDPALATRALSGPGAHATEGELRELEDLASRTEYAAAAQRAATALGNGRTDIRILTPFLLGVFLEGGPESLAGVLGVLRLALSERWSAIRPEVRKERVTDSALSSLFRSIVLHIDFHTTLRDASVAVWPAADAITVGQPSLLASNALRSAIEQVIAQPRSTIQLSEVDARIRKHFDCEGARAVQPRPAKADPAEVQSADVESADVEPADVEPANVEPNLELPIADDPEHAAGGGETHAAHFEGGGAQRSQEAEHSLELSPPMQLLLRKLAAFETLASRGELERAAIVAEDVRSALDSFDPRVYFPRLLASYARVLATHVNVLVPHWDSMGSPSWRAQDQLYRLDLDAFLAE